MALFLTVSDLESPPENSSDEQDIERFWESVHLKMINRGFFQSELCPIPCFIEFTIVSIFLTKY